MILDDSLSGRPSSGDTALFAGGEWQRLSVIVAAATCEQVSINEAHAFLTIVDPWKKTDQGLQRRKDKDAANHTTEGWSPLVRKTAPAVARSRHAHFKHIEQDRGQREANSGRQ